MSLDELGALKAIDILGYLPWWRPKSIDLPRPLVLALDGGQQDASGELKGGPALKGQQVSEGLQSLPISTPGCLRWQCRPCPFQVPLPT